MNTEALKDIMGKKITIDIDEIIKKHNEKYPDSISMQIDRKKVSYLLGCKTQVLSDWKNNPEKVPTLFNRILKLQELSGGNIEEFITIHE